MKVAPGPRKKPSDFDGNPDHVTLALELKVKQVRWGTAILHIGHDVLPGITILRHRRPCRMYTRSTECHSSFNYAKLGGNPTAAFKLTAKKMWFTFLDHSVH